MHAVEVSTVVYATREKVYEFLLDFTGYGQYSAYVEGVEARGDGGRGTEYDITVSWWKLSYTATSEVTATVPPDRIEWRLLGDVDARGHWRIEGVESTTNPQMAESVTLEPDANAARTGETTSNAARTGETASNAATAGETEPDAATADAPVTTPPDRGPANRVVLRIEYDPDSVSGSTVSLPAFVPLDVVVDRVAPHVETEAESIVEDVVADLEGERRPVELTVEERPDGVEQ